MKSGYDQFFKKVKVANTEGGKRTQAKPQLLKQDPNPYKGKTVDELLKKMNAKARPEFEPSMTQQEKIEMVRDQLRQKRLVVKERTSKKVPWVMILFLVLAIGLMALGWDNIDDIEKVVKKVEFSVMPGAHAEEAAKAEEKKEDKSTKEVAKPGETAAPKEGETKPQASQGESGQMDHFSKLTERKKELDAREEELNRMEAEINAQKEELAKKLVEIEQTRKNVSQVLEEKVSTDQAKIDSLVQLYSSMKPQQAAQVFETIDEDLAIEIISKMKKKNAAEILNLVKPEKAKLFSEKYAGYKRK